MADGGDFAAVGGSDCRSYYPSKPLIYEEMRFYGATIQLATNASPMRFFHIMPGASLTLSNLTLSGGMADPSEYGAGSGGAIYNEGSLDLEGVNIVNCQAVGDTNAPGLGANSA